MNILWILLASVAGACIALQAAANGSLRANLGDSRYAAFFSICGTFATAVLVVLAVLALHVLALALAEIDKGI